MWLFQVSGFLYKTRPGNSPLVFDVEGAGDSCILLMSRPMNAVRAFIKIGSISEMIMVLFFSSY
jgi:hypothetical protein